VNGAPLNRRELDATFADETGHLLRSEVEVLDGRPHAVLEDPAAPLRDYAPLRIEPGRYFMMGDNRNHSNDSRSWGTVRLEEFKGPAFILYWSWDWNGSWLSLLNPLTWWENLTGKTRWGRMGRFHECL
jgi:signal peptidase I